MAKKRAAQRFLEALGPRTEGQRMRAPAVRGTMEYSRGQVKGAGVGAGAGAAAGAGGTYLAMRGGDDDEDNKRMRNALATARSGRADDDLEEGYPSVSQRRAAQGAAMAEGLPEDGEVESGAAAGGARRGRSGPYDNMSFGAAFRAARADDKATFSWRGNSYTTEMDKAPPMSKPAVASKKGSQYGDEDEPVKLRKGGGVRMAKGGLAKLRPPKAGPMPKMSAKAPKSPAIARFAKGGEVRGMGAAMRGSRGCKKY